MKIERYQAEINRLLKKTVDPAISKEMSAIASAVSKNLNYLVVGEKAGSKLKKAQDLGTITILDEQEFLDLIK